MTLPRLEQIEETARLIATAMKPTPEICWATLSRRCDAEVWVKHENHTPIGAFKIRGGLVYIHNLIHGKQPPAGIIAATRGNHGQSIAYAARRYALDTTIVVPHGNSAETNFAMQALGANLLVHGHDFQAALEYATSQAAVRKLAMIPSFHELLVRGVATCGLEFLRGAPNLETVYVPVGLGSGICAMIAAREALGRTTKVVGVVAENAPAYALSYRAGKPIATESATTIADGVACRVPDMQAVEIINRYAERIVEVSEAEIRAAMRHYFTDTHNVAEGAGAVPLAALLKESEATRGRRVGLVLTGGNVDRTVFAQILRGDEP
jgi:threonine dehydratase